MKYLDIVITLLLSLLLTLGVGYENKIIIVAGCLFLALIFLSAKRWFKWVFIFPIGLVAVLYFQSGYIYGHPNIGIIASLFETDKRESIEFLLAIPIKIWILNMILLVTFIYYLIRVEFIFKWSKTAFLFGCVCFYFSSLSLFISHCYTSTEHYIIQIKALKESIHQTANWTILKAKPKYKIYVLIIGESMRKDYMSSYGYPLNTTPFLATTPGIFVNGYLSTASHTAVSLPRTLGISHGLDLHPVDNIVTLANAAKMKTIWLSNQGFIGKYDTAVSAIAVHASEKEFLKKGNFLTNNTSDYALLPLFKQALAQPYNGSKLIVLHIMGSHENFCDRIKKDIYRLKDKDLSCYLSTYNQTDTIIKKVVNDLKATQDSYSLIYFSDHGLNNVSTIKGKTQLVHGDLYKQNYEVPLIEIASDMHQHIVLNKHISAFNFMSIFSNWIGVKTIQLPSLNVYQLPKNNNIQVLSGNKMVLFRSLKNDPDEIIKHEGGNYKYQPF
ncbi:phosphoethanolamine transferase [Photobacterium carnosum]|uniref:phosphoethanolamine transferase n=1 Tax=Photobacterium carnosum TaxID=2023717 RepID=UPI001E5A66B1|nr:phosphoethanolamine transferase [Photobacterium carnosum]MCD9494783.1 sulfatase-like hydrolase/transferase [Photobacterium carnosum]